ncbi:MAG TPA: transposase [Fermentimonas sp.]|nr:transposase [Fermentimonas sp.]
MIPREKALQLTAIYLYICELYESELQFVCQRFSNNNRPEFSDQELITIYLFVMHAEQRLKIKHIHQFAKDYLHSWFPKLPSYVAFNTRLNRMSEALEHLSDKLMTTQRPDDCNSKVNLLDSMPIITCSGKRHGKVAKEITDKTFCSTKGIWYYGLKLHVLGMFRPSKLPFPESVVVTQASENDLNAFKQNWADLSNRKFYGDKIYHDTEFFVNMAKEINSTMLTPVKGVKGQPDYIKFFDKAANDLYSRAVSTVRQPIEAFFNWINEKTNILRASNVRSTNGLLVHVFGKLAAAFIGFIL